MGNFYVNHCVKSEDRAAIISALKSAQRTAFVSMAVGGVVVVFDAEADTQHPDAFAEVGQLLCKIAPTLAAMNHDDSVLYLGLYRSGEPLDSYDSHPGYFDDAGSSEAVPKGGDAELLCAEFGAMSRMADVENILRAGQDDFEFALDRHEKLCEALGLPWPLCAVGFNYVLQGDVGPDVDVSMFERT